LPMAVTGERLLRHLARLYQTSANIDALMDRLYIQNFKNRQIRRLSGGQRQRLGMAAALVGRPRVDFLVEPWEALQSGLLFVFFLHYLGAQYIRMLHHFYLSFIGSCITSG